MSLLWIKYTSNARAITEQDSGEIYATVRTIKKRNRSDAWEVKAYGRYEKCFPELERVYDYEQEFADKAATEIAYMIKTSQKIANRLSM